MDLKRGSTLLFGDTKKSRLIIMGKNTYLSIRDQLKLSHNKLRIVMTRNAHQLQSAEVPGQLEFNKQTPTSLVLELEKRGYKEALLVGGEEINGAFIRDKLIDELWLTIEPKIFGQGKALSPKNMIYNQELSLISHEQLNKQGTILLKYKFI